MFENRSKSAHIAVLSLERECVEWLSRDSSGRECVTTVAVQGQGPEALAKAAVEAAREAGSAPGRCVVALGTGLVKQRLFTLPALSRAETRAALARKAAGLCEGELDEVAFTALCVDGVATSGAEGRAPRTEMRWLIVALKRDEARRRILALSKAGFHVVRTVSSQLSCLARAAQLRGEAQNATIAVSALRRSAAVALIQGDTLLNENLLDGDVRAQPALAMSIVQELKSFDAAWRKANRGGAVAQVVLLGLPRERAPLFKTAVQAALPNAVVILPSDSASEVQFAADGGTSSDSGPDDGRIEALSACRTTGGFQMDLTLPTPLRPKAVALSLVALFATLTCVATVAYKPARSNELKELEAIAAIHARTAGLEGLRRANARDMDSIRVLEEITARNADVLSRGWPLRVVAGEVLGALDGRAALVGLDLGEYSRGQLEFSGVTSANPARAILEVQRITANLESIQRFDTVVSEPSGTVPTGEQPISFKLKAHRNP